MATYKGLILDFGGVVTTDFYGALDAWSTRAGLGDHAFTEALSTPQGHRALAGAETGQIPQAEFEQVMAGLLGVPARGLLAAALADLKPRPEMTELASRARAVGVRVAALSNSWGEGDYDPYAGWPLDDMFDAVIISHQVGLRKPEPGIFTLTADALGLPAAECLFIDDTERNLPGAAELGMGTLLFTGTPAELAEIERLTGLA